MFKNCDFLIVGGGSAGSIVARRLADANIGKVILVEAGSSDENKSEIRELARLEDQGEGLSWGFTATPHHSSRKRLDYLRAKMLGGCANHNDCAFLRPPDSDFDNWAKLGGDGWDGKSVAPYFERVDTMVSIDETPPLTTLSRCFMEAGHELGLATVNFREKIDQGVGPFPLNVDGLKRSVSSSEYLHPLDSLPENLEVICDTEVNFLEIDEGKIQICRTNRGDIRVNREVLLCAGSIQSPQLLMLSGIGPGRTLQLAEIETKVELPGVGENLLDHAAVNLIVELNRDIPAWKLTPCEVTLLLKTDNEEPAPDILYHFVLVMRDKYGDLDNSKDFSRCVKIAPNVARPKSRGRLCVTSPDFYSKPEIQLNYFSDPDGYDLNRAIAGLRYARQLLQTQSFNPCLTKEIYPGIRAQTDEELAEYILDSCDTVYHPSGTCRMGHIKDSNSVTCSRLKVKGIENLRVCDASVFPSMVSVNINNTVMMVAEKAADLIVEDWQP